MTGGEGSDEDVDPSVVGLIVLEIGMDDFDGVVVDDSDLTYVVEGIGDDGKEMVSLVNRGGGGFEEIFAELAPEAVEHEFGGGFTSGIFLDETGIEFDTFFLLVSGDVLGFVLRRDGPSRVASGFLLDLEPRVDVILEQSPFTLLWREVMHFVDFDERVSHGDGFQEFGDAPGPSKGALFARV